MQRSSPIGAGRLVSEDFENTQRYISIFGTRTRFVMMVLLLLCLTSIWSNILTWNIGLVCMHPDEHDNSTSANSTHHEKPRDLYEFTQSQQQYAISVVAVAALLGNFPVVYAVSKVQIRTVFALLGILSAIATLLLPLGIRMGYPYILGLRALQGFAFAANFPVIGAFASKWTYFKQNGLFVSALVAYVQLAPAITNPVSGLLCGAFHWPSIFYAHGAVSLILFVTYGLFYRNSPNKHPFVGQVELNKISIGKVIIDKTEKRTTPYREILLTPAVWAIWIASLGNFTCVNTLFLYSPLYLSKILGFSAHNTGFSAALPPLAQFAMKIFCGAISDKIKCLSEVNKFRMFNSIAFIGSSIFLGILAAMPAANPDLKMVCMFLLGGSAGILGATTGGFFKAGPILSKQYSHFVTGNISLGITITMVIVPFVVTALTPNNTADEWRWVFIVVGIVLCATNLCFVLFVKGEAADWTRKDFVSRYAVTQSAPAALGTIGSLEKPPTKF